MGRLEGGVLTVEGAAWPPAGACVLVLWRPGEQPAFEVLSGALRREGRVWRWEGEPVEGWVVAWARVSGLGPGPHP